MDFVVLAFEFFFTYQPILLSAFVLGLCQMLTSTFSVGFGIYSVLSLILFFVFGLDIYLYIAIASVILTFILKMIGL